MSQIVLPELSESGLADESLQILCGVCDEKSAILIWDDRYAGYRGRCSLCKYDWPES
jgi:hypothetical protein